MSSSSCVIVDILANEVCCLGKGVLLYSKGFYSLHHKADRVLSFFSSRRNWDCSTPSPAGECSPPPGSGGGGHTAGEGVGSPNSDAGTDTVVL